MRMPHLGEEGGQVHARDDDLITTKAIRDDNSCSRPHRDRMENVVMVGKMCMRWMRRWCPRWKDAGGDLCERQLGWHEDRHTRDRAVRPLTARPSSNAAAHPVTRPCIPSALPLRISGGVPHVRGLVTQVLVGCRGGVGGGGEHTLVFASECVPTSDRKVWPR